MRTIASVLPDECEISMFCVFPPDRRNTSLDPDMGQAEISPFCHLDRYRQPVAFVMISFEAQ